MLFVRAACSDLLDGISPGSVGGLDWSLQILSGKFGIVDSWELISDYDFRLLAEDVPEHSLKVGNQLKYLKVKRIIFFTRPLLEDINIKPYLDSIQQVSKKNEISLTVVNLPKKKKS